jgi:aminoglycoside/choline kinase family phosphotransferase
MGFCAAAVQSYDGASPACCRGRLRARHNVNTEATVIDARAEQARLWALAALGLSEAGFAPASADASFRRYFRVSSPEGSWIVMDAPPQQEDCGPFLRVAALLRAAGVHVPAVLAEDLQQGFLLLSDLGRQTYLDALDARNADALFSDAIDALILWQKSSRPDVLPPYDDALLRRELKLFPDWFIVRHLGRTLSDAQAHALATVDDLLVRSALAQPRVFVHRDYMPRNLMRSSPNPGVLDFQDAVYGPVTYDLVCLFKDAFLSWPAERVDGWIAQYRERAIAAGVPVGDDPEVFRHALDLMGVQRHLKVLGIFARILHRDGKPKYIADAPRFVGYIRAVAARYPELSPLQELFDELELP